jgi:hypothetical protein
MKEKTRIIGYRLKDQSLRKAASQIVNDNDEGMKLVEGYNISIDHYGGIHALKEAGVLDL